MVADSPAAVSWAKRDRALRLTFMPQRTTIANARISRIPPARPHSSAIVKAIAEGTIEWEVDPDFGYKVASQVPGIDAADIDLLQPRRLYEATGRGDEYRQRVERLKAERAEFLAQYPSLSAEIVNSVR